MIRALLFILSFNFSLCAHAQTDVKKMNLLSNVKSLKETSFRAQKTGNEIHKGIRERAFEGANGSDVQICFNKQQYKTIETHFSSNGSVFDYLYFFYNDSMKIIKWYCYAPDSSFKWGYHYDYNNLNFESSSISLNNNKKTDLRKVYTYNSKGLLKTETTYFENGDSIIQFTEYDELQRTIQKRSSTGQYEKFNYEHNKKVWTIFNRMNDTLCQTIYEYDQNGNVLKLCSRDITLRSANHIKKDFCVINTYDKYENETSEQWIDSKIPQPKETFEYMYDEKGNWIQKIHL